MAVREVETASPEETEALGERLGRSAEDGLVLGLMGELGAGKTCLVRGFARGLGVDPGLVASPTFVIATEYGGGPRPLHHVDLYRLEPPLGDTLFLREVLYGAGVAAVEWFDRLAPGAEDERLLLTFRFTPQGRAIRLDARGPGHVALLARAAIPT